MSQAPDVYTPETIVDRAIPLLNGSFTDTSGTNSKSSEIVPPVIPDVAISSGIIARDVISQSLNTATNVIKGNYRFEQMGAITVGTSTNGVSISPLGIIGVNSGATTFSLDTNGNAYFKGTVAAGSVVTGYLIVGGAASDINGNATTIDGGKITTGSITASQIAAGTITATQISGSYVYAGNLSASQITTGTLSADIISGGTINASSINVTNLNADNINSGSINRPLFVSSSTVSWIKTDNGGGLRIAASAGSIGSDRMQIGSVRFDNSNDIITTGYGSFAGGVYLNGHLLVNGNSNGQIKIDGTNKSAIVRVDDSYKALYCIESPEVWFMDFCDEKDKIDPLFIKVTEGDYKFLRLEDNTYQVWRRRKGHAKYRFEDKTKQQFEKNERFLQMAK